MLALRQLAAVLADGAVSDMSSVGDFHYRLVDVNPRMVMKLTDDGRVSTGLTQVASGGGTYTIPLPQSYVNTNQLYVLLTSDQTVKLTLTTPSLTSNALIRAGLNQVGIVALCDLVNSLVITNAGGTAANVEWFLFELPAITTTAGWRDGSLALGTL